MATLRNSRANPADRNKKKLKRAVALKKPLPRTRLPSSLLKAAMTMMISMT